MARAPKTAKKPGKKPAAKGHKSRETIDCAARDALYLLGKALAGLQGLESEEQARVTAAAVACAKLEG